MKDACTFGVVCRHRKAVGCGDKDGRGGMLAGVSFRIRIGVELECQLDR